MVRNIQHNIWNPHLAVVISNGVEIGLKIGGTLPKTLETSGCLGSAAPCILRAGSSSSTIKNDRHPPRSDAIWGSLHRTAFSPGNNPIPLCIETASPAGTVFRATKPHFSAFGHLVCRKAKKKTRFRERAVWCTHQPHGSDFSLQHIRK